MGANKIQNLILVLSLSTFLLSCDNKANIPYSRCECYENYYDIKKGKYDDYALRGNFMRKNNLRKNTENKTDEVVQFTYLDSVDREIRRQCIKKYGKEVEQFGECD